MMSRNEIQDRFEWLGLTRIIVYLCVLRLKLYYFINIVVCLLKVTFPSKKKNGDFVGPSSTHCFTQNMNNINKIRGM